MIMNTVFDAHDSCMCVSRLIVWLLSTPCYVGKRSLLLVARYALLFMHQTHKCGARPSLYTLRPYIA